MTPDERTQIRERATDTRWDDDVMVPSVELHIRNDDVLALDAALTEAEAANEGKANLTLHEALIALNEKLMYRIEAAGRRATEAEAANNAIAEWLSESEDNLAAALARSAALEEALRQIADPSYVGNYVAEQAVSIYRTWATNAIASAAPPAPKEQTL